MGKRKTKNVGDWRIKDGRRILHCFGRADAKKQATFFITAGAKEIEIQERYPSGTWVTTDIVNRNSLPL